MAVPVITGGPPAIPAVPVLLTATPADIFGGGFAGWTGLPVGTWFVRAAAANSVDPDLIAGMSNLSNELSFTVAPPVSDSAILTWTVDPTWPVGTILVLFISQVPDYFGAPTVVTVPATQVAGAGLFAAPLASAGTVQLTAPTGFITLRQQNLLPNLATGYLPDTPENRWNVSGGTDGDPIDTLGVVAAIRAAGETVEELDPAGSSAFDFQRNAYFIQRGVNFTSGVWRMGQSDMFLGGTFNVQAGAKLLAGTKLPDGSRVDGPTIGMLPKLGAAIDPDWAGDFELYSGALVSMHDRLGPAVGVADPDPTNDWMRATPAHDRATATDTPPLARMILTDGHTYRMGAMRIDGFTQLQLQLGAGTPILDFDTVGLHDVNEFILSAKTTYTRLRMENCKRGFGINVSSSAGGVMILDQSRVVSYQTSAIYWGNGNPILVLLDFTSDEDVDSDDPTVTLTSGFIGFGQQPAFHVSHRFNVKVVDSSGAGVSGTTVVLTDGATTIFSAVTGADGQIPEQQVARYIYERNTGQPVTVDVTGTLSGLAAAGWLLLTREPVYELLVQRTGFETYRVLIDPDRALALVLVHTPSRMQYGVERREEERAVVRVEQLVAVARTEQTREVLVERVAVTVD